jgi:hypothetical protein
VCYVKLGQSCPVGGWVLSHAERPGLRGDMGVRMPGVFQGLEGSVGESVGWLCHMCVTSLLSVSASVKWWWSLMKGLL